MKHTALMHLSALLIFLLAAPLVHAKTSMTPPIQSGYWNLETNLIAHDYTTVRFYNDQHQLVYEETLPYCGLDLSSRPARCRRIKQKLDVALQQVLSAPATAEHAHLRAAQFDPKSR